MSDEIQCHAFGGQNATRRTFHRGESRAGRSIVAVLRLKVKNERGIDKVECHLRYQQARDGSRFARHQQRFGNSSRRHDQIGGDVARAAEIFFQRTPHDGFEQQRMRRTKRGACHEAARVCRTASRSSPTIFCASAIVRNVRSPTACVSG